VKFTEAGEVTARLVAERVQDDLQVSVIIEDTGCGIPPDRLELVFERFRQGDGSTTRRFGGTGLGLAISRDLAVRMGGTLEVKSTVGEGSRFTLRLRLPVAGPGAPPSSGMTMDVPIRVVPRPDGGQALPVLVVEDDAVNRLVCTKMLERLGVRYRAVENGAEAVDAVAAEPFSLVLMDCHMPVMDGFEATRRIRGTAGDSGQTPIVALTALAVVGDRERCIEAGMDDFLSKPISQRALAQMLEQFSVLSTDSAPA
ncbi:MAG: response regulator, partial [Myxococcales bacterium]|nr:response regulator [Myxococcales bacterium]